MIDINYIRENPDRVKEFSNQKNKKVDIDAILRLDAKRKELQSSLDTLNQGRNAAAKEKDIKKGKELKKKSADVQNELTKVEEELKPLLESVPNIPSEDTPIGKDESGNVMIREVGDKPEFSIEPKEHWELGKDLDLIDSERAVEVSGSRFSYLKGDLVLMQFGLVQIALKTLTDEALLNKIAKDAKLSVSTKPFIPVMPPLMMRADVMQKMARLEPRDERYHIESDDMYLIGSAEHTLGPMHMNETFAEKDLPIRYVAHTSAFRREAGTYGKDTKGIIRLHQFEKAEMVSFSLPENSTNEHLFFIAIQEYITQLLELPYKLVLKCTGDQGGPDARAVDIETWMPGQGKYRETHTADLMTDYQARRLNTKIKRTDKTKQYAHMNDATVVAGRTLVAIMENYQQEDGTIRVPTALQPYVGKEVIGK